MNKFFEPVYKKEYYFNNYKDIKTIRIDNSRTMSFGDQHTRVTLGKNYPTPAERKITDTERGQFVNNIIKCKLVEVGRKEIKTSQENIELIKNEPIKINDNICYVLDVVKTADGDIEYLVQTYKEEVIENYESLAKVIEEVDKYYAEQDIASIKSENSELKNKLNRIKNECIDD